MTKQQTVWMTRSEAADYLRVTTATLDRWVREKRLPRFRVAGKASARFRAADLDAIVRLVDRAVVDETEQNGQSDE